MIPVTPNQVLTLYTWFMIAILLTILLSIARFYQNLSKEQTHYRLFVIPIIIFGIASARYAFIDSLDGDVIGDLLWLAGGILLIALCVHIYNLMTSGR